MAFRAGLFPSLLHSRSAFPHVTVKRAFQSQSQRTWSQPNFRILTMARSQPNKSSLHLYTLGLGLTFLSYQVWNRPSLSCQAASSSPFSSNPTPEIGGAGGPKSELSGVQLGFGAVCGICTGVFVKKGLKAIAFLLGGVFVLMQYLSSKRFISVDWGRLAGTYDKTFGTKTPTGEVRAPSVGGVWAWFVDFVTANFQQRASFLAGLALGLRLG